MNSVYHVKFVWIGDESHFESLGKAGGAAEISQFEQNQSVQGSVSEF